MLPPISPAIARAAGLTIALAAAATAQHPIPSADVLPTVDAPPTDDRLPAVDRVPAHRTADGSLWTAGRDWKARIDADGMTFLPVLGDEAPHNLPFAWRTVSLGFDDGADAVSEPNAASPLQGARVVTTPWQIDLVRPAFTERYVVRADGLEQQWLIPTLPEAPRGRDLVVRGRITGALRARDRDPQHAPVDFRDASGAPIVEYGRAIAIDARGDVCPMTTAVVDGDVVLRVPAAFLATAALPLWIDPVTRRSPALAGRGTASFPSVAEDYTSHHLLVSSARASSASDYDLFVHRLDEDFTNPQLLHSELGTDSVRASSAGYVNPSDRFVVAMSVQDLASWRIRVLFHDADDPTFGSGTTADLPWFPGIHLSLPTLGCSHGSPIAYLAVQSDDVLAGPGNSDTSEILGYALDTVAGTVGSATSLSFVAGRDIDCERPQITAEVLGGGFVVVWQEWDAIVDAAWNVVARRIGGNGSPVGSRATLLGGLSHEITPMVAGSGDAGRFLVATVRRPFTGTKTTSQSGDQLVVRRFSWPSASPQPSSGESVFLVDSSAGNDIQLGTGSRPIAYDDRTGSHWTVAWRRTDIDALRIARIGYDSQVVELADLEPPAPLGQSYFSPTLCLDRSQRGVVAIYASSGAGLGEPLMARRFVHDPTATAVAYGTGCTGSISARNLAIGARPLRGSEFFRVDLDAALPNTPTWLFLSLVQTDRPLPAGGPGCRMLIDPLLILADIATVTDATGAASIPLSLPSSLAQMPVFWQFVQFDGVGLVSSDGLRTDIR